MNNKGQIGKLISIFPLLFLIFIIMGIFVVLSAAFSIGKSSESPTFMEKIIVQDNLMLKTMTVITYEKDSQGIYVPISNEMSVLDAVVMYWKESDMTKRDKMKRESVGKALESLLNENANCLFIYSAPMENPSRTLRLSPDFLIDRTKGGSINHREGNPNRVETVLNTMYQNIGNRAKSLSFMNGNELIYVDYYYGACE